MKKHKIGGNGNRTKMPIIREHNGSYHTQILKHIIISKESILSLVRRSIEINDNVTKIYNNE